MSKYYARNDSDVKFDTEIRETVKAEGNKVDMAFYKQNQEILNLLRTVDEKLKGYPVPEGYRGWIDHEKRYRLFDTEGEYREFIAEVE